MLGRLSQARPSRRRGRGVMSRQFSAVTVLYKRDEINGSIGGISTIHVRSRETKTCRFSKTKKTNFENRNMTKSIIDTFV